MGFVERVFFFFRLFWVCFDSQFLFFPGKLVLGIFPVLLSSARKVHSVGSNVSTVPIFQCFFTRLTLDIILRQARPVLGNSTQQLFSPVIKLCNVRPSVRVPRPPPEIWFSGSSHNFEQLSFALGSTCSEDQRKTLTISFLSRPVCLIFHTHPFASTWFLILSTFRSAKLVFHVWRCNIFCVKCWIKLCSDCTFCSMLPLLIKDGLTTVSVSSTVLFSVLACAYVQNHEGSDRSGNTVFRSLSHLAVSTKPQ